jgi:hypothetical protein
MNQVYSSEAGFPRRNLRSALPILLLLPVAALVMAFPGATARGEPAGQNTLTVGSSAGTTGSDVSVLLYLANEDAVGGIQLDVLFDPASVNFTSAALDPRANGMALGSSVPSAGRLRVLMYFVPPAGGTIAPGNGAVASLTFHVVGTTSTTLIPDAVELSSAAGQVLAVTASPGAITVTGGGDPTGACCALTGACTVTTQAACAGAGETWRGASTTCTPNPCPAPTSADTLRAGTGSGAPGEQVTIPISLKNGVPVRGIQADIVFDQAVLRFDSGVAAPRAGTMSFSASSPSAGRVRMVMYFADAGVLAAGDGAVANLVFRVIGALGSRSPLTPADILVAGQNNTAVTTVPSAGEVTVTGGPAPPDLRLAVLKNPGRTRTLQVFVSSDVPLDAPPAVNAGDAAVPVTQLPGMNIYQGSISLPGETTQITVQASGRHDGLTGTTQATVTF